MAESVSILMSVFNGGPYLEPAISGLLGQTLRDFELVVLDNGSTDGSSGVLRSFNDPRLRLISVEKTIPRTAALNVGLRETRGELVAVQDADDTSLPDRLEKQAAFMEAHPEVALVGSWVEFISENGGNVGFFEPPTTHEAMLDTSRSSNPIAHSSVMFRRSAVVALGGYPKEYVYAQDFALWVRLMRFHKAANLPIPLVKFRIHSGQMSSAPELRLIRTRELVQVLMEAASHPEIARLSKTPELAEAMLDHALALYESHKSTLAWYWVARTCFIQPHRWLRRRAPLKAALTVIFGPRSAQIVEAIWDSYFRRGRKAAR
jgi:hypothetical protein